MLRYWEAQFPQLSPVKRADGRRYYRLDDVLLAAGICEALRSSGLAAGATDAGLSRGLAGVSGSTVVVNLASSRAAIRDGMATLCPLVSYVVAQISALDDL